MSINEEEFVDKPLEEYSEEMLKVLKSMTIEAQLARIELNKKCKKLYRSYKKGMIPSLVPQWHTSADDIDFKCQPNQLSPHLLIKGYSILQSVNMEAILNSLKDGNAELYRQHELYGEWHDIKICRVVDAWLSNQKLIPPTLVLNEETNSPFLADGKHRFNVAYNFGQTTIPVIVPNIHVTRIKKILQIKN